ncbi:MAG: hypothetical protein QME41_01160 [Actinomycetota bacterium]|nr:hypothetical protein [Actinomycetota bacterium]
MLEAINAYDHLIARANKLIVTFKIYPKVLDKEEHKYLHPICDKGLFNALNMVDLIMGLKYLDVSNAVQNQSEANYFARIVAHSAYEILNHQNKILGIEVIRLVEERLTGEALSDVQESMKALRRIKKEHFAYLKFIRNNLFGHKLGCGIILAESMLEIDNAKTYSIGKEILMFQVSLLSNLAILIGDM